MPPPYSERSLAEPHQVQNAAWPRNPIDAFNRNHMIMGCARCHDHKHDPIPAASPFGWPAAVSSAVFPSAKPTTTAITWRPTRCPCTICRRLSLHCLGVDHQRLTFKFQGSHFRLTDVAGNVTEKALA